jgi:precorrin-4/cobalt-precorrin-4 C11-methyltransferase
MKKKYPIVFAGAGPGDPELITVKASKALMAADLVIYTGSLVPEAVLKWAGTDTNILNSASMHLEDIISCMEKAYLSEKKVVRLHTGDPSLYGAIFEQMAELDKKNIPYQIIPGVTAAFAAAASLGIEFTLPEISQTLILTRMAGRTTVPESEQLEKLASHQASMAIYLSMTLIDQVEKILVKAYGKDSTCAVVFRASQPEEKILLIRAQHLSETVKKENIQGQAVILAGKIFDVKKEELKYKSKLYDKNFSHQCRKKNNAK